MYLQTKISLQKMAEYDITDFLDEEELDTTLMEETLENDDRSREELLDDGLDSEGKELYFDVKSLYSTLQMVNTNYALLNKKRDEFTSKEAIYWMKKSQEEMDEFFREYLRLLHNYAASVHTLTHHTYTFLDRYENKAPELRSKYSEELAARNLGVKVNLLKQIRHYTQKNWEPPLSAKISPSLGEDDEETLELSLDRDKMLDWDGWSSDVRPFLESFDESIIITDLAEEYQAEVNDFYDWLRMLILSTFYDKIAKFLTASVLLERDRNI